MKTEDVRVGAFYYYKSKRVQVSKIEGDNVEVLDSNGMIIKCSVRDLKILVVG